MQALLGHKSIATTFRCTHTDSERLRTVVGNGLPVALDRPRGGGDEQETPVDFLTDEQARRYSCFNADPTSAQLSRYFYLAATN
jgi:hypothetical protein